MQKQASKKSKLRSFFLFFFSLFLFHLISYLSFLLLTYYLRNKKRGKKKKKKRWDGWGEKKRRVGESGIEFRVWYFFLNIKDKLVDYYHYFS